MSSPCIEKMLDTENYLDSPQALGMLFASFAQLRVISWIESFSTASDPLNHTKKTSKNQTGFLILSEGVLFPTSAFGR